MNDNNNIVWGTCWYNEPVDVLIKFFKDSLHNLEKMGFNVTPIVFDARFVHNNDDISLIKKKIKNVVIILNHLNVFPNKNYGVALITNIAYKLKIKHIAIVDPDWDIKENNSYIKNILLNLIDNDYDLLIPNIGIASGRSNILIGRTVIKLFYPEYEDVLQSVFPGAIAAKTSKLYQIVNDNNYHFDWGGEWDIISLGIRNNMLIGSSLVDVTNVRHRSNTSKMQDSFQIWKAIFANDDIIDRYKNVEKFNISNKTNRLYNLISDSDNIMKIIDIINNNNPSKTEKQILYMILYPLALIMGEIDTVPEVDSKNIVPYDKMELYDISEFAIYCMKIILKNSNIKKINKNAKIVKGIYFSKWDNNSNKNAMKKYEVV